MDNLNFYSAWLPAGQQTDRYSSQPWCLRSKNLDIFSSSKSVKATAWSEPTTLWTDIIKQDWNLILKNDGKVYDISTWTAVLVADPSTDFPVYQVSYTWWEWPYENAQWGTTQDMFAKYSGDEWRSYVVFTDRASFVYSKQKFIFDKSFGELTYIRSVSDAPFNDGGYAYGYKFNRWDSINASSAVIHINMENAPFSIVPLRIFATENNSDDTNISLSEINVLRSKLHYDAQTDSMIWGVDQIDSISFTWDITTWSWVYVEIPISAATIELKFSFTKKAWASTYKWPNGELYIDVNWWPYNWHMMKLSDGTISNWDCNYYYTYLPIRNRKLVSVWDYGYSASYWMKGASFQTLYKWISNWQNLEWDKKVVYDFVADMGWETDVSMDVIGMMIWNEQVYMIGNMDWNWYIIPCDLTWGRGTPFIAYGCAFKWVANIDYLMYLVWDDRWVSQFWVYNGQELVSILGGTEEKDTKNLIDTDEQYRFDWKMIEYRGDLILSTEDNRVFAYGQTFGGKWGIFIHELPWTITDLKADKKDLVVGYSITSNWTTTKYTTALQDDRPTKRYNTEWMAEYPIVIWNHLLEKEESDLYASYILPSSACKLEFWGMANHYHFWTFTSADSYNFSESAGYKMKGCTWNYSLKYIEKNGNQYTFRLEWDLPIQTTNDMKITDTEWVELITYSEYNHFRKIWEITTTGYQEWEFRFHNLNNKLELPKSHSLQIMVKGKGNQNYTAELFALDLVANQRERW